MTNEQPPEWRTLSEIIAALEDLRPSFPADGEFEDALANAVRSGKVLVRARPFSENYPDYDCLLGRPTSAFKPIEAFIGPDTEIKLAGDFISVRRGIMAGCYLRAEADLRALRKWVRENALPASSVEADSEKPTGPSLDAPGKKPFPAAREPELKAFLINHAREQEIARKPNNDETAHAAAARHFPGHSFSRKLVRKLRKEAGCLGRPGALPKSGR